MKSRITILIQATLVMLFFGCDKDNAPIPDPLTITETTVSGFNFTWNDTSSPIRLQVSESADFSTIAFDSTYSNSPSSVEGLKSMQPYHIRYAFTSSSSTFSENQPLTTNELTPPQGVLASIVLGDSFKLSWTDVPGADYSLDVSTDIGFSQLLEGYNGLLVEDNQVRVEAPDIETTYYFRLKSVNGDQESQYSEIGNVTTTDVLVFSFSSPAFANGETMPAKYACSNPSPPLQWKNPPEGTVSIAIIMDDLDFPGRVYNHWVIFNISADVTELLEGASGPGVPHGSTEGINGLGQTGYFGPCPPNGETHRYEFTLYALDTNIPLGGSATKGALLGAMNGHILGRKTFQGLYN